MNLRHTKIKGMLLKSLAFLIALWLACVSISAEEGTTGVYHCHDNGEMKIALTFDDKRKAIAAIGDVSKAFSF